MPTSPIPQNTDFSRDVLGRYVCNGLDEALASSDPSLNPNARPFDVIVVGGGSFGPILAQHLLYADQVRSRRTLVLEAGRLVLTEHVQNLPILGLNVPGPVSVDPGVPAPRSGACHGVPTCRAVFLAWPTASAAAPCISAAGRRSCCRPRRLPCGRRPSWPISTGRCREEATAISVRPPSRSARPPRTTSSSESCTPRCARSSARASTTTPSRMRSRLPNCPCTSMACPMPSKTCSSWKRRSPCRHSRRTPASFPFNKFSSLPLLIEFSRAAQFETGGDDTRKRLMVVPDCHVTRLITDGSGPIRRVIAVETNRGVVQVPEEAVVVLALGTIENGRIALVSLPGLPGVERIGANLMAHLRSNLTIRLPRAAIAGLDPAVNELQASALFVKGPPRPCRRAVRSFSPADHRCGLEQAEHRLRGGALQEDSRRGHDRRLPSRQR